MMSIDDAQPGSPAPATNPYHEMPIDEIQKAESEIDRLHEQHLNGGHRLTVDGNILHLRSVGQFFKNIVLLDINKCTSFPQNQ